MNNHPTYTILAAAFTIAITCAATLARADMDHMFGYGSTTAALAGSNRARSYDAFAILQNPALMSQKPEGEFTSGFLGAVDYFQDLENVVIDNPFIGGSSVRYGSVDTDVPDVFNFMLGSLWTLRDSHPEEAWRFGMTLNVPADKVMEPQTKDIYQPQYAMYLANTHRLGLNFALSRKFGEKWSVGAGVAYYLMTGATVVARLPADGTPSKTSTANLRMIVKPALAPLLGVAFMPTENETWTLNYKGVKDARVATKFDSTIEALGSAPFIFNANGSIFYDPETFSLGYANVRGPWEYTFALDYERWSMFEGAVVKFEFETFTGTFRQYPFDTWYKDIWVPRVGLSYYMNPGYWRVGYAYKPSPTPELRRETNFLDSDRHILGLGYDWEGGLLGLVDKPVRWSTHLQGHYLNPKDVVKENSTDIGAPGYTVKGFVISYGINLTIHL
ncbi:MAG TPA: outer membrane protein transport protein [Bdellovibrionales bacterium]|nr:outer membrane protein transport protein [Bdellovibrionales bacterium]